MPLGANDLCGTVSPELSLNPNAWTAVARLPAARFVVFDPVSNSFAFVSPCVPTGGKVLSSDEKNVERLDRRRLALTTQKISLLIMPYNPLNGVVTLISTLGTGTEIDETVKQDQSTTTNTSPANTAKSGKGTQTDKKTPRASDTKPSDQHTAQAATGAGKVLQDVQTKAESGTSPSQTASQNRIKYAPKQSGRRVGKNAAQSQATSENTSDDAALTTLSQNAGKAAFRQMYQNTPGTSPDSKGKADYWAELVFLGAHDFDEQSKAAVPVLATLHQHVDCATQHVAEMPIEVSRQFRNDGFNLANDITLKQIEDEAKKRLGVLKNASTFYKACTDATGDNALEADIAALQARLNASTQAIDSLAQVAATQSRYLEIAAALPTPKTLYDAPITADQWNSWISATRADIKNEQSEAQALQTELQDVSTEVGKLRSAGDTFLSAVASPASEIQRFNFVPLRMNQSITFKISRGAAQKADGDNADIPERVNSLTLLSAPAYRVRLGAGAVDSWLANPTFKAGEKVGSGANAKTIISADDTGGSVLPAAFAYHHWGYRCPFLEATTMERLLPTFSVGVAADGSKTLQQVLLGLTWPLADGFALNAGWHWGDVNGLEKGLHLGDAVPSSTDVSTLVSKRYTGRAYVGIILNSDTFQGLRGSNK